MYDTVEAKPGIGATELRSLTGLRGEVTDEAARVLISQGRIVDLSKYIGRQGKAYYVVSHPLTVAARRT